MRTFFWLVSMVLLVGFIFEPCSGECCTKDGAFSCCGNGACNFFCCNCDGGCNSRCQNSRIERLQNVMQVMVRRKRETNPVQEISKFSSIDLNSDGLIDFDETVSFYKASNQSEFSRIAKGLMTLDKNNDGFIQPAEFDSSFK